MRARLRSSSGHAAEPLRAATADSARELHATSCARTTVHPRVRKAEPREDADAVQLDSECCHVQKRLKAAQAEPLRTRVETASVASIDGKPRDQARCRVRSDRHPGERSPTAVSSRARLGQPASPRVYGRPADVADGPVLPNGLAAATSTRAPGRAARPAVNRQGRAAWVGKSQGRAGEHVDDGETETIWRWMLHQERELAPNPSYLVLHPQLQPKMRAILVDWMKEVCEEFGFERETFYLAVNMTDRYLSNALVSKSQLQLVGVTSLWISSKLEETTPPKLMEFADITDKACSQRDILCMERSMYQVLDWQVLSMTWVRFALFYCQALARAAKENNAAMNGRLIVPRMLAAAMEVLDLAVLDVRSLRFAPSVLVAAAFVVGPERVADAASMERVSGYTAAQLRAASGFLARYASYAARKELRQPPRFSLDDPDACSKQTCTFTLRVLEKCHQKMHGSGARAPWE